MLGALNRMKRCFVSGEILWFYKAELRPLVEYCSHLSHGPFGILLGLRREYGSVYVLYGMFHVECFGELLEMIPSSSFYHHNARCQSRVLPYYLEPLCSFTVSFEKSFFCDIRSSFGMNSHPQCFLSPMTSFTKRNLRDEEYSVVGSGLAVLLAFFFLPLAFGLERPYKRHQESR